MEVHLYLDFGVFLGTLFISYKKKNITGKDNTELYLYKHCPLGQDNFCLPDLFSFVSAGIVLDANILPALLPHVSLILWCVGCIEFLPLDQVSLFLGMEACSLTCNCYNLIQATSCNHPSPYLTWSMKGYCPLPLIQ